MSSNKIENIVVVGGGTAGWTAAAAIAKLIGANLNVTLVESDAIGTVGVGEATIPPFRTMHRLLKIDDPDFLSRVQGTFKLAIQFENWRRVGHDYIHSFGVTGQACWAAGFQHFWLKAKALGFAEDYGRYAPELMAAKTGRFALLQKDALSYAYHLDATAYAGLLRQRAEKDGVTRVEGKIVEVRHAESGDISGVVLESGKVVNGDLFIDCSGFVSLLLGKALGTEFEDWTHWLPCDRAIAVQTESVGEPIPYTRAIARESGWQWRIPLQTRVGNGLVFCSAFMSDDEARESLLDNLEGEVITEPRVLRFRTGQRKQHWNRNCIGLGLASGFLEPLESTSIHLIQRGVIRLMQIFPYGGINDTDREEFNRQMDAEFRYIRDFIIMHYHVTERTDSEFWRRCREMDIPDSLQHRLDLFRNSGLVFEEQRDIFRENSWVQVMLGQGLEPQNYHAIVDMMDETELRQFMQFQQQKVDHILKQLPTHQQFIDSYCATASA
ncbi:MAG: tryptophan halogenase family protein [Woeseiaceae bacterium]|nr:tryptophan halogenase family protein [Woeseiaceae bacterium]